MVQLNVIQGYCFVGGNIPVKFVYFVLQYFIEGTRFYTFAMKYVKICHFKARWGRIFARRTLFPLRYFSIHVKMCALLTYSVIT